MKVKERKVNSQSGWGVEGEEGRRFVEKRRQEIGWRGRQRGARNDKEEQKVEVEWRQSRKWQGVCV